MGWLIEVGASRFNRKIAAPRSFCRGGVNSALALGGAAARIVPGPFLADVDMHRAGTAIGAYAAASGHGAQIGGEVPFRNPLDLHVGRHALHVQRLAGASGPAIVLRTAKARRDDDGIPEMLFGGFQNPDQTRLQASRIDLLGLQPQAVRRQPAECSRRRDFDSAAFSVVIVVVDAEKAAVPGEAGLLRRILGCLADSQGRG